MKILAIDSSGMPASVAVCDDGVLQAEYTVNFRRTHSQTLVPMLDEVRSMLEMDLAGVDAVAVAGGPGSFTGLRIGSASAKGIGLALGKPLIHVPTLEGLAYNFYGSSCLIVPMIDARNSQVFAGIYTFRQEGGCGPACCDARTEGEAAACGPACCNARTEEEAAACVSDAQKTAGEDPLCILCDQDAMTVANLCERLNQLAEQTGKEIILLGDGASVYREFIEDNLNGPHWYAPAHLSRQKAGSVAVRAIELGRQGRLETAAQHRPDYLRVSQAERVRAQKNQETVQNKI